MDIVSQAESDFALLKCDVVIVGGGMAGLTLALALAKNTELSIVILEANPESENFNVDEYHHRVSALALSSVRILQSLNVWDKMQARRVSSFAGIQVWDAKAKSDVKFNSNEIGENVLGYIVENNVTQMSLREMVLTKFNIKLISPAKLTACDQQEYCIQLTTAEHGVFHAQIAVAADGANSWLRNTAGIRVTTQSYEQEAIVASVITEMPHEKIARQVFLPDGPLAFLPLQPAATSSIVWSLPSIKAREILALPIEKFQDELTNAFGARLGKVNEVSQRFIFPLKKQQAENYIKQRVVLIGDAAHVVHPLAGQGINLGMLDAASLAQVLLQAHAEGRDLGQQTVLRRYERWRRADNLAMLQGIDLIKQIFASSNVSMQAARAFGLAVTSRFKVLKNIFTRHAVGCREGLPIIAKK